MTSAVHLGEPATVPAQHRHDSSGTAPAAPVAVPRPEPVRLSGVLDWCSPDLGFARTRDRLFGSAVHIVPGAEPLCVDLMATYLNDMWGGAEGTTSSRNFDRPDGTGDEGASGLCLHQTRTRRSPRRALDQRRMDRGNYTFSFNRPVSDLTFSLTFLDARAGQPRDAVQLSEGFRVLDRAPRTTGAGTSGDPFRIRSVNLPGVDDHRDGDVRVTYPGELSTFSIDYWNIQEHVSIREEQAVCVGELSFTFAATDDDLS